MGKLLFPRSLHLFLDGRGIFFPLHNLKHHMCSCSSGMWIYLLLYRRCHMCLSHGFICHNGVFVGAVLPPPRLLAFPLDLVLGIGVYRRLFAPTLLPSYQRSAPAFGMFLAQRQQSRHFIAADIFFFVLQNAIHCALWHFAHSPFSVLSAPALYGSVINSRSL